MKPHVCVALFTVTVWSMGWGVNRACAEPAFLSKQYTRCTSCHISPTGGGLLSPYGRALSNDELSLTAGRRAAADPAAPPAVGEQSFLWGALGDALGPLQLGVELRPSRLHTEAPGFTIDRNLMMNADVIAAVQEKGWTFYGEVGREPTNGGRLGSYEHWVGYESARGLGARVGRFLPAYGVRFADHTTFSRSVLGFEKYDQVYGLELSRNTERTVTQVTFAPGLAESFTGDAVPRTFNTAARLQVDLGPTTALVASGLYRSGSALSARTAAGGLAIGLAPAKRLTVWGQGDLVGTAGLDGTSYVLSSETSFEALRGLWFRVSPQLRGEAGLQPQIVRWTFSATLLPRTHVNVNTTFYRDKASVASAVNTWLIQLHLYL